MRPIEIFWSFINVDNSTSSWKYYLASLNLFLHRYIQIAFIFVFRICKNFKVDTQITNLNNCDISLPKLTISRIKAKSQAENVTNDLSIQWYALKMALIEIIYLNSLSYAGFNKQIFFTAAKKVLQWPFLFFIQLLFLLSLSCSSAIQSTRDKISDFSCSLFFS